MGTRPAAFDLVVKVYLAIESDAPIAPALFNEDAVTGLFWILSKKKVQKPSGVAVG